MARSIVVSANVTISSSELQFSFVRSAGPGGQNVNKRSSKAVLRWNVRQTESLSAGVKQRFLVRHARRINQDGELVLASDRFREQARNIAECERKLREMVSAVLLPPRIRKQTRRTHASVERRLRQKQHKSDRKRQRHFRPGDD